MVENLYSILNDLLDILQRSPLESLKIALTEEDAKQSKLLKAVIVEEDKKDKKESSVRGTIIKIARTPIHKLNNVMFKKMLIKMISFFYEEIQRSQEVIRDFGGFVYSCLFKKYMMKKAAENRFFHLLSSCMKYKQISKVRTFSRFIGLFDSLDYQDLSFYLENLNFLNLSTSGGSLIFSELTDSYLVPYSRCLECLKNSSKDLPSESLDQLKTSLEKLKKSNKQNLRGVLEMDDFLEIMVDAFSLNKRNNRNFMRLIYDAADLNNDGYLQYREFELLVKFLSEKKFTQSSCFDLFSNYAENFMAEDDEQVKAISFINLCELDKENNLFSQNLLISLIGVSNEEEGLKKIKALEGNLDEILEEVSWRFGHSSLWEDHQEELSNLLKTLKDKFKLRSNAEEALLALKLLQEDSKRTIVCAALNEFLPIVGYAFCNPEESAIG
jgi:hypothetical protein